MQIYYCNHCGLNSESIFNIFLHIFTDHLHKDIGLSKEEGRELLKQTYLYEISSRTSTVSLN